MKVSKRATQPAKSSRGASLRLQSKALEPPLPSTIESAADGFDKELLVRRITQMHFVLAGLVAQIRGGYAAYIGVSTLQYVMLQALGRIPRKEGWTVSSIAKEFRLTDAYVSNELADLVTRDFVCKTVNPNDRRVSVVALTARGRSALAKVAKVQKPANTALYGHLDEVRGGAYAAELETLIEKAEVALALVKRETAEQKLKF